MAGRECFHHEINSLIDTRLSMAAERSALSITGQYLQRKTF